MHRKSALGGMAACGHDCGGKVSGGWPPHHWYLGRESRRTCSHGTPEPAVEIHVSDVRRAACSAASPTARHKASPRCACEGACSESSTCLDAPPVRGGHGQTRVASPPTLVNVATMWEAAARKCAAKAEPSDWACVRCGAGRVANSNGNDRREADSGGVSQNRAF
eukprot:scaffold8120_cov37-Tisochrysis_lutea.AAC.2